MSQPVGIIAKIIVSEDNYKRYIRKTAGNLLGEYIFDCIKNHNRDYYIFRYLKKENALYAFFYFNYGDWQFLLNHPLLAMLKNIEPYLDDVSTGYLIANRDSLNYAQEDFPYAAKIENTKIVEQKLTEEELKEYWQDAQKHFFKYTETDFSLAIQTKQIVDKTIIRRVEKLQEQARIQNLRANLHTATIENPIELFNGYFYNGNVLYTCNKATVTVFDNINLQELRQTTYGLCDNKGVIVNGKYLQTDPSKFKKHQKGEICYYSSAEAVYNQDVVLYTYSDGTTFRMLSEFVAEDREYIYFVAEQLPKENVGIYQVNDSGYFHNNILLYTPTQIRAGKKILEGIDAVSFRIISQDAQDFIKLHNLANPSGVFAGCFVLHCSDKDGELIIHNYDINKTTVEVERISSLQEYEAKAKVLLAGMKTNARKHYYPEYKDGDHEDYYTQMSLWLSENFEEKYKDRQYNLSFYIALNNYFYCCFQLYLKTGDKLHLQAGTALFEKIAPTCFVNPYIFHNTAYLYAALSDVEKAVGSVSAAVYYGYEKIELIWNDTDLKNIFTHPDFITLRNYYEQTKTAFPVINIPILDKIEAMPEGIDKKDMVVKVAQNFTIPDAPDFTATDKLNEEEKSYCNTLRCKVAHFINYLLQQQDHYYDVRYNRFKDNEFLTIKTHLFALNHFFSAQHRAYGTRDISLCLPIAEKIKSLIKKEEVEKQLLIEEIKANDINKIFQLV